MSRLDSFIRRMQAQRDCLNAVAGLVADVPGAVLELGLGNGRTYDHLREVLPGREIYVFERKVAAHPDCIPDDDHLLLGEIHDTLPNAATRIGGPVALVHSDIGSGDAAANAKLAAWLGPQIEALLGDGAIVLSDQEMTTVAWQALPLPDGVQPGRYHMYRFRA